MRSGADLRGASPLVSFNHVIGPHFVTFSSSLYTTICNPKSNPTPNLNSNPDPDPNPDPNPNPNPNPTVITDPQIGRRDPQIVTVQIRPADLPRSAFCSVPTEGKVGLKYQGAAAQRFMDNSPTIQLTDKQTRRN